MSLDGGDSYSKMVSAERSPNILVTISGDPADMTSVGKKLLYLRNLSKTNENDLISSLRSDFRKTSLCNVHRQLRQCTCLGNLSAQTTETGSRA